VHPHGGHSVVFPRTPETLPHRFTWYAPEKELRFVSVLTDVTLWQWPLLFLALAAFAGPGLALAAWGLHVARRLDFTQEFIVGFALSLSLWAVLFSTLSLFDLTLPPAAGWLLALGGWGAYALAHFTRRRAPSLPLLLQDAGPLPTALLWLVVAATAAVSLWALQGVVVQPGSDGYHHTLIAQAIAAQGRLPDGLFPLTTLVTFTYHFGYHVFIAVIEWMTGISTVALTPILAQLLKAFAALAVAFLTEALGERRRGAVVAASVAGLISVFPAYYVNWGRNTQVTGLVILCVLLALVWLWCRARPAWSTAGLLVLLAVGLAFAHYRVTLMAAIGCAVIVLAASWQARWGWQDWRTRALHAAAMLGGALLLAFPWLWQVSANRSIGFSAAVSTPQATFFEISRLGALVLAYATNLPLLFILAPALAWGLWKRSIGVLVMLVWALLLYILSQPWLANQYMDTITVVQSLFVPGAVIIGLAAALFMEPAAARLPWRRWVVGGATVVLALLGANSIRSIVEPGAPYVLPADLAAVQWVRDHTPADALFMVNTFAFDFVPEYVIGSDAGGWLPVLAGRRVVTAPMTYPIERSAVEHYPAQIRRLAELSSDLATPAAVAELRRWGVTHVFVGARGGPIAVDLLRASNDYELLYEDGHTYIFRLREEAS
jgi:hypothetical protein